jgi:pimeloyl-ACP methyl ester carboxylesterase
MKDVTGVSTIKGTGATNVLVLHGWGMDSSVWKWCWDELDLDRFTYAFFDFPGYGSHRPQAPANGIDGMARAALEAADGLGWDSFAVLGHSMGGGTAIRVATLSPDRVTSVCALTPVSPGGTPLDETTYDSFRSAYPDCGPTLKSLAPFLTDAQLEEMVSFSGTTLDKLVWDAYLANWTGASFAEDVASYSSPTTLVVGEGDPFVTAEYLASTLAELRVGTLVNIAGAGHYPMIEQAEQTVAIMEKAISATKN